MGLRIGTNVASLAARRHLERGSDQALRASRALASGSRIGNPGDDAAGFAIAESLRGQAASLSQAKRNSDDAQGLFQVAEGGLSEQNNILVRLRELAVQSASDTVGDTERGFLDTEFQNLVSEFDRIAETTIYSHKKLLTGSNTEYSFHLGAGNSENDDVAYKMKSDTRASSVDIKGLDVADKGNAKSSITSIDNAMEKVAQARASFGAMQSRFSIASNNLAIQEENVQAARSRIADADVANETANLAQAQVLQEFGTAVLAQANQSPARALKLLV
jgi:flagellin